MAGYVVWRHAGRLAGFGAATAMSLLTGMAPLGAAEARVDRNYPAPAPVYPRSSEVVGAQGDVMLDVLVTTNGRPRKIRLSVSSGFPALDNAAVEAAANWRFVPVTRDGDTVSSWTTLRVRFQLPQVVQVPAQDASGQWPGTAPAQKR